jgi:hypothetical protein
MCLCAKHKFLILSLIHDSVLVENKLCCMDYRVGMSTRYSKAREHILKTTYETNTLYYRVLEVLGRGKIVV